MHMVPGHGKPTLNHRHSSTNMGEMDTVNVVRTVSFLYVSLGKMKSGDAYMKPDGLLQPEHTSTQSICRSPGLNMLMA